MFPIAAQRLALWIAFREPPRLRGLCTVLCGHPAGGFPVRTGEATWLHSHSPNEVVFGEWSPALPLHRDPLTATLASAPRSNASFGAVFITSCVGEWTVFQGQRKKFAQTLLISINKLPSHSKPCLL